ncbi:hypothetical protein ACFQ22_09215 [Lentilactobacillus raoultii]|uniref:Uncharacterized protein n=1 Tax=Lentilactobacillus raoultii TaxID=1987503 RepID=A0ABW3PNI7_9LACO|nr:hypothetical protein [Lentilactobacillus raoultii]
MKLAKHVALSFSIITIMGALVPTMTANASQTEYRNTNTLSVSDNQNKQTANTDALKDNTAMPAKDYDTSRIDNDIVLSESDKELAKEALKEVSESLPDSNNPQTNDPIYGPNQTAWKLMATLVGKYGMRYVERTLPKKMYSKVSLLIGSWVSEKKFVSIWQKTINVASGQVFVTDLTNLLRNAGLSKSAAGTSAEIIVDVLGILA